MSKSKEEWDEINSNFRAFNRHVNQPDTVILSDKKGIESSKLVAMPTYSPSNGVTTGVAGHNGKVYIKMVDESHPDGYTEHKVVAEEVYNSEDGDLVIVGYANPLRSLAYDALYAAYRYIETNLSPRPGGEPFCDKYGTFWSKIDPEWERDTIQRLGHLIKDELEMNEEIPQEIKEKYLNETRTKGH